MSLRCLSLSAVLLAVIGWLAASAHVLADASGYLAFSARVDHNWDIYVIRLDGGDLRRMTAHPGREQDPAWSPDGRALAYSARRNRQWDLYVLDVTSGEERRLTVDQAYDGAPAWSPDGRWIAYESMASGDLDIWIIPSTGGEAINLTEDSPAGDFGPMWAPTGPYAGWLAFTSWRLGDKDVFLLHPETGELQQVTHDEEDEELAGWSADGRILYIFRDEDERREVWALDLTTEEARLQRRTWLTRIRAAVEAADGLAVVYQRADGEGLLWLPDDDGLPGYLVWRAALAGRLAYHPAPVVAGEVIAEGAAALDDAPMPQDGEGVARFVELSGVTAQGWPASLSSQVADSFLALRERVREETGYDFLSELSDAWRPPSFYNETSDYLSWHKTGRAVDVLLDFYDEQGEQVMERVRESMGGETFWRIYLRCRDQDGSCGRPLTDRVWDLSHDARANGGWGRGGLPGRLYGQYFVDFTALAREYGWRRIGSYEEDGFDWRTYFTALEYWHYERRDGQLWYPLMLEVLDPEQAKAYFSWEEAISHGVDPFYAFMKGLPLPAHERHWQALRP